MKNFINSYMLLALALFLGSQNLFSQVLVTSPSTFNTAGQGDLYVDSDGVYYIGLQNGTLKEIGTVVVKGTSSGNFLIWNTTTNKWEVNSTLNSTSSTNAEPVGVDASGKLVKAKKATLTNNGNGTASFSNGFDTTVTFTTQASGPNAIVASTLWIDNSNISVSNTSFGVHEKSFTVPGGSLGTKNAIRCVCYRTNSGSQQIKIQYGGQAFYTTGNLGNSSSRFEFIIFGNGATNSQKSFMDDANTGTEGQRYGTVSVDSTVDQTVKIQMRRVGGSNGSLDFCSAELLQIGN